MNIKEKITEWTILEIIKPNVVIAYCYNNIWFSHSSNQTNIKLMTSNSIIASNTLTIVGDWNWTIIMIIECWYYNSISIVMIVKRMKLIFWLNGGLYWMKSKWSWLSARKKSWNDVMKEWYSGWLDWFGINSFQQIS